MRLVAWNVNYNNRHRPFDETVALLQPLRADVLVLSETALPKHSEDGRVQWIGDVAPGLAIVVSDEFELTPHTANAGAAELVGAFSVRGRVDFELVAAWPVQRQGSRYHEILMATLDRFEDVLGSGNALMAGDLNSSSRVSNQRRTHPVFVARAGELGLVSAYHERTGEPYGAETVPTYMHGPGAPFHLDYCFVPRRLAASADVSVLREDEWASRSDHFPLVVDIPDGALAG
jgi:endonuclease/exonuclease/phosphatase (EEP) superfamily protein YafD